MLGGVMWAGAAGPRAGIWMATVALLAAAYDVAGRGPLRGPLLLGLCRAGNLGAGLLSPWLVGGEPRLSLVLVGALTSVYGLHVAFLSSLGRLEDGEDEQPLGVRPTRFLTAAALHLFPARPDRVDSASGRTGARSSGIAESSDLDWGRRARDLERSSPLDAARQMAAKGWTRELVGAATGLCLRRLPGQRRASRWSWPTRDGPDSAPSSSAWPEAPCPRRCESASRSHEGRARPCQRSIAVAEGPPEGCEAHAAEALAETRPARHAHLHEVCGPQLDGYAGRGRGQLTELRPSRPEDISGGGVAALEPLPLKQGSALRGLCRGSAR